MARRTTVSIGASFVAWSILVFSLGELVSDERVVGIAGAAIGLLAIAGLWWFERWQTAGLPPLLARKLRRRPGPHVAAGLVTVGLALAANRLVSSGQELGGYARASLILLPVAVVVWATRLLRALILRR